MTAATIDCTSRENSPVRLFIAARAATPEHDEFEGEAVSPEALQAGHAILAALMAHLGYDVTVEAIGGETSRLNVLGANDEERQGLGALIGRKGERLSALQHLLNLMLSMLAALQAPIIMMSQNRQAAKDRLEARLDCETNLRSEAEIANLQAKVDRLLTIIERR